MGVPESWIRDDEKAGSVDLSMLALPVGEWERPESVSFKTKRGLWYRFSPHENTALSGDTIEPVKLKFDPSARIGGPFAIVEELGLAVKFAKNWLIERRNFQVGLVAVKNTLITEGDSLEINGHSTSPVDVGWVTERVNPETDWDKVQMGSGTILDSGEAQWNYTRTVANF